MELKANCFGLSNQHLPVAGIEMLDKNRALISIYKSSEHPHALVHVVAHDMVGYGGQHSGLNVHLEFILGLRLLQTEKIKTNCEIFVETFQVACGCLCKPVSFANSDMGSCKRNRGWKERAEHN
jgi:hypothetical protein